MPHIVTRHLVASLVLLCAFVGVATAQVVVPVEVFLTSNGPTMTDWDNIVLRTNGVSEVVTFDFIGGSTIGTYGTTYTVGAYEVEAFFIFNGTLTTAGHYHLMSSGGNPGAYEEHHQSAGEILGLRLARIDGQPFELVSIEYLGASADLWLATTIGAFTGGTPTVHPVHLSQPNWLRYVFSSSPGAGQAPISGFAELDINGALDALGNPVSSGLPGPYVATATPGGPFALTVNGQPDQPIILLVGPLNPGAASFGAQGQLDLGISSPVPPFVPTEVLVVFNGFDAVFPFFRTGPLGTMNLTFTTASFPPGTLGAFQAVVFNSQPTVVFLTNAVEVLIP